MAHRGTAEGLAVRYRSPRSALGVPFPGRRRELDIQRDHPALIDAAYRLLAPGGVLYFSTNRRRFQFHPERLEVPRERIREITGQTVPADYRRQVPPHRCWRISAPAAADRE
ncbi:MAG: hypothetical protein U5L11_05500 [Arhodomonas sp.]|nr:hypothetical protein [Arhodomonas sp.]